MAKSRPNNKEAAQAVRRAVIMAGGEGTRMRPFTYTIPKPLLPVGRKPVSQIIVERLKECGIKDIIMSLEYGADLIRAYFQNGKQFGTNITYFHEPKKLGTAGCLAYITALRSEHFIVTNGDVLTDLDYRGFLDGHIQSGAALTVATRWDQISIPYGVLRLEGDAVQSVEEKPKLDFCINAGVYALSPSTVDLIPQGQKFDMTELITTLIQSGKYVRIHPINGLWFDLAKVNDFEKAVAELEKSHPELL